MPQQVTDTERDVPAETSSTPHAGNGRQRRRIDATPAGTVYVGGHRNLPARGHHVTTAAMTEGERLLGPTAFGVAPGCRCQPQLCRLDT